MRKHFTKPRNWSLVFNDSEVPSAASHTLPYGWISPGWDEFFFTLWPTLFSCLLSWFSSPRHVREVSLCSDPKLGLPTTSWDSGWMCQSKSSHGESMSSPMCFPNRSPKAVFSGLKLSDLTKSWHREPLNSMRIVCSQVKYFGCVYKIDRPLLREATHRVVRTAIQNITGHFSSIGKHNLPFLHSFKAWPLLKKLFYMPCITLLLQF